MPASEARDGVGVADLVLGFAFDVIRCRPRSTGRGLRGDRLLVDHVQRCEGAVANGPALDLNPGKGGHCVRVVAEAGRDLDHAVGQGVQTDVPGRGGIHCVHSVHSVLLVAGDPGGLARHAGRRPHEWQSRCRGYRRKPCRGLLGGEALRDCGGVADISDGVRGTLQEAQEGLNLGGRDRLAATGASIARELWRHAAP